MKFPDWLTITQATLITEPDGQLALRYEYRPRRWHPGYWRARWRTWRGRRPYMSPEVRAIVRQQMQIFAADLDYLARHGD